ncbi:MULTISPECIES: toll/interleukin-1 receptor domain-containing protein [Acinetobacter]|uniref:toll/interleukin-1 receptor domain-containing protein n=1 Tax=Acinetobacter TaxID=469 RepID=UPI0015D42C32|nr:MULTISPECIES: toll/interleukin-1 receptor domain-containing protein [Acinetobacter]MCL6241269.1 toll/interleukin-1 receptor domain-containing protein [Acinetobacter amyesii]
MVSNLTVQNINRFTKEIADLNLKISQENKKEATLNDKINQILKSLHSKNISLTTLSSKTSDMNRKQSEVAKCQQKKAELQKKLAIAETNLLKTRQKLSKEQEDENKKLMALEKKLNLQQIQNKKAITQVISNAGVQNQDSLPDVEYDFFISHASEDKEEFVRTLYQALIDVGYKVWFDEITLKIGDSLTAEINKGLIKSKFAIVVASEAFIRKNWTRYEFESLVAQEMDSGTKRILPIWHGVSKDQIISFSPNLANKVALNTANQSIVEIVEALSELIPVDEDELDQDIA